MIKSKQRYFSKEKFSLSLDRRIVESLVTSSSRKYSGNGVLEWGSTSFQFPSSIVFHADMADEIPRTMRIPLLLCLLLCFCVYGDASVSPIFRYDHPTKLQGTSATGWVTITNYVSGTSCGTVFDYAVTPIGYCFQASGTGFSMNVLSSVSSTSVSYFPNTYSDSTCTTLTTQGGMVTLSLGICQVGLEMVSYTAGSQPPTAPTGYVTTSLFNSLAECQIGYPFISSIGTAPNVCESTRYICGACVLNKVLQ